MKPRIAITLGDPAGIGPEIVSKACRHPLVRRACHPLILGTEKIRPMGRASRAAGLAAIEALEEGLALVRNGQADALVTAPVSKESFRLAAYGFPGHTEWLAKECGVSEPGMLMVSGPLRAILMTRHVPLAEVPKQLSARLIRDSAELAYRFVKTYLKKPHPKLVVCGLNPHAGDHGILGKEEQTIFRPALQALNRKGISVTGPLAADTVFPYMAKGRFDVALAAYHDQGMIPLKLFSAHRMVNITLGLPFIRTSPAHGTAYDIAGKGKADPRSTIEAILLAAQYSRCTNR